jgi:TRAP transporter TAXI family solute receptor
MNRILPLIGMTIKDIKPSYIGYNDASLGVQDGNLDATFVLAGAPTAAIMELGTRRPIRFIEIKPETVKAFVEKYPFYTAVTVPKEFYKTPKDVSAVGVGNLLIVNKNMNEELAYKITNALFGHIEEFQKVHPSAKVISLETATNSAVPLHPGALRFYKEKGVLK